MQINDVNRAQLHGTGCSASHVEAFLNKIDEIIFNLNPIIANPGVFTNPVIFQQGITIPNGTLGSDPGSVAFNTSTSCLEVRNIYANSILQIGQELYVHVCNATGETLVDGTIVYLTGYDPINDCFTVAKAKADSLDTAQLLGVVTTTMIDGAKGLVTVFGRVNEIDTTGETPGKAVYLSATEAGKWTTTKPAVAIRIGYIGCVGETGCILVDIRETQPSIYGSFYSAVSQTFDGANPQAVPFDGQFGTKGLLHSTTVNPNEITFLSSGIYVITFNAQLNRTAGGASPESIEAWLQKYPFNGTSWNNVDYTLIGQASTAQGDPARLSANVGSAFNAGDKLRVQAESTSSDIFFEYKAASGVKPAQASVMFSIYRLGDV